MYSPGARAKLPEREVDHPFPFGAEVNNAWRCAFVSHTSSASYIVTLMSQIFLKLNDGRCVCVWVCFVGLCVLLLYLCMYGCVCAFVLCSCVCLFDSLCVLVFACFVCCNNPSFRECVGRKIYRIYVIIGI
jgi:hypothetical protein